MTSKSTLLCQRSGGRKIEFFVAGEGSFCQGDYASKKSTFCVSRDRTNYLLVPVRQSHHDVQ